MKTAIGYWLSAISICLLACGHEHEVKAPSTSIDADSSYFHSSTEVKETTRPNKREACLKEYEADRCDEIKAASGPNILPKAYNDCVVAYGESPRCSYYLNQTPFGYRY